MGAEGRGSVSFEFVSSWLSISGLGPATGWNLDAIASGHYDVCCLPHARNSGCAIESPPDVGVVF